MADGRKTQEIGGSEDEPSNLEHLRFADNLQRLHADNKLM